MNKRHQDIAHYLTPDARYVASGWVRFSTMRVQHTRFVSRLIAASEVASNRAIFLFFGPPLDGHHTHDDDWWVLFDDLDYLRRES
jgi:hypothetical protein